MKWCVAVIPALWSREWEDGVNKGSLGKGQPEVNGEMENIEGQKFNSVIEYLPGICKGATVW